MSKHKKPYDRTVHRLREIERFIKTIGKRAGAPRVGWQTRSIDLIQKGNEMPNWSHNSCTVTGPETDIKAMFDLMVVIDWVSNNWGTSWNASNFSSNYDGGPSATFEFNTAWEFPKPIAEALSEEFPSLRFVWKVFNESLIEDPEYRGDDCEYHGGRLVSANWYERPFA